MSYTWGEEIRTTVAIAIILMSIKSLHCPNSFIISSIENSIMQIPSPTPRLQAGTAPCRPHPCTRPFNWARIVPAKPATTTVQATETEVRSTFTTIGPQLPPPPPPTSPRSPLPFSFLFPGTIRSRRKDRYRQAHRRRRCWPILVLPRMAHPTGSPVGRGI